MEKHIWILGEEEKNILNISIVCQKKGGGGGKGWLCEPFLPLELQYRSFQVKLDFISVMSHIEHIAKHFPLLLCPFTRIRPNILTLTREPFSEWDILGTVCPQWLC